VVVLPNCIFQLDAERIQFLIMRSAKLSSRMATSNTKWLWTFSSLPNSLVSDCYCSMSGFCVNDSKIIVSFFSISQIYESIEHFTSTSYREHSHHKTVQEQVTGISISMGLDPNTLFFSNSAQLKRSLLHRCEFL
jgi:hypothetical protein